MTLPLVIPLFDKPEFLFQGNSFVNQYITNISLSNVTDAGILLEHSTDWLYEQKNHENNYKAYRSELTTFLHWCFDVASLSPIEMTRKDMAKYINYCQNPPSELIGYFNVAQFKGKAEKDRIPNSAWKPFVGKKVDGEPIPYELSDNALKTKLGILSSFYTYLITEEYCEKNVAQIWMNHSRFSKHKNFKLDNSEPVLPIFTDLQWSYVMSTVTSLANENPIVFKRHKFLVQLLYSCYLRISDVSARSGYSPVMGQFIQNRQTGVWLFHIPQSKGGKKRTVTVSNSLLEAFKEYRKHLELTDLPSSNETTPLFIRHKAAGRGRQTGIINANLGIRQVREDIQNIIDLAAQAAQEAGFEQDAIQMKQLSAHNIRHTGISHDINLNNRPLAHVQADAGHESIDTTSQYIHTSDVERAQSAANKSLNHLEGID
ncbi:site-specific integrase [Parashewanella spongiae]|uniref:Site-specific integrase n=1 Tax=Parashewanella spongiae TaxID=342950 RepID=A0A3A6TZY7_9GAMM|nr:site-specific integrase [Parashewanella spongiae]MCL1077269.1 site-specific integrase [Parashewanella spongiae]RJY18568.1 site-specific integrase [Parashewanella spongiae]